MVNIIHCKDNGALFCTLYVVVDATELRNLIELSTFEDNVCAMDRIARLHTVGAQIAPLVYDLKENSDFDAFMKICEAVWLVLKANKSLAKSLVSCMLGNTYIPTILPSYHVHHCIQDLKSRKKLMRCASKRISSFNTKWVTTLLGYLNFVQQLDTW